MEITYKMNAWVDMKYTTIDAIKSGDTIPLLCEEAPGEGGYCERKGYAPVGTATVVLSIKTDDEIVAGQVESLKSQLESVRADAQQKENQILRQISQLQALTMS